MYIARHGFSAMLIRRPCFGVVAGMHESLMADEQVASSEGLGADVANEGFLFRVCSADAPISGHWSRAGRGEIAHLMCLCRCSRRAKRR